MKLTPEQRTLRAQAGGNACVAKYGTAHMAKLAKQGVMSRWRRQVDPDGVLDDIEREKRALAAMRSYMAGLALKRTQDAKLRKALKRTPDEISSAISAIVEPPKACPMCFYLRNDVFPAGATSALCLAHVKQLARVDAA